MVDRQFSEPELAALYDELHPGAERADFAFYRPLVMAARSVLDVGCGTGELLRHARAAGHSGRLCGLDPAAAMLEHARTEPDVEWVHGTLATQAWDHEFDLIVMTGHAFQVLVDPDEMRGALRTICTALTDTGRFAFETRNPEVRGWEQWTPEHPTQVVRADGAVVRMIHAVDPVAVEGELVSFTTTYTNSEWERPQTSRSTLRFVDAPTLSGSLADGGLAVDAQFGDWDRTPLTATSPEIITIAVRAPSA